MKVPLISLAAAFALLSSSASAIDEAVVLPPENAADHGFSIRSGLWDQKQGSPRARQPEAPPVV